MVGMFVAHIGVALCVAGVTYTSAYSDQRDVALKAGESYTLGDYSFELQSVKQVEGPNYVAQEAAIGLAYKGESLGVLKPQKRLYRVQKSPMTESDIHARLSRDVYVAIGEDLGNDTYSLRLQIKPMVRFIWLGALIMALGGFLALTDRRYYRERRAVEAGSKARTA